MGGGTPTKEIKCFILEIATFNWMCWQTANTSMKYHYGGISSGSALFFLTVLSIKDIPVRLCARVHSCVCMSVCII